MSIPEPTPPETLGTSIPASNGVSVDPVAGTVRKRRLQSGLIFLVASLLVALGNVLADHGHPGFELPWRTVAFFVAYGLYNLWLSTPRIGAARFEAAAARNVATTTIPVAFFVGLVLSILLDW